jgi:ferric-dicitrate binding protein FerR (iron transport regulator)
MNDDYLWNRSGPPDPDIQRLEQRLGRLRSVPPLPQLPEAGAERTRRREYGLLLAAAAAAIVLVVGGTWRTMRAPAVWEVASVTGQPRIGSATLARR